jgi:thiol-disulfide isomerase/thioredoxin
MPRDRPSDSSSPRPTTTREAVANARMLATCVAPHLGRQGISVVISLVSLAILALASAQTRFEGDGRVVALDSSRETITLDHGPIPGLMAAMQMEFPVRAPEVLHGVRVGDVVRFSLEVRGPSWVVTTITKAAAPATVMVPAPDFDLPTLAGERVRLGQFRGKVVLLNFWATWCVPCRTEIPAIEALFQRHREQGLEVIAINLDKISPAGVEAFLKEVKVTFRVVLDPSWSTTHAYGVVGLPTTYLIDRAGRVVVREVGERDWTDQVTQMAVARLLH